ncbi:MAG: hypothetical protein EOP08_12870 [Proteobacteria bacterium]|nr:MAG: hypothetical protein EOP08_12870 [Pseudomonadota bacterium]
MSSPIYHQRSVIALGRAFPEGVLEPGLRELRVDFDLPAEAPPSYRSTVGHVQYELHVQVRIPWWLDLSGKYPVHVEPLPVAAPAPTAVSYTTSASQHTGAEPVLELSLEDDAIARGSQLRGALALAGLGGRTLRRIDIELHTVESSVVDSVTPQTVVERFVWNVHEGHLPDGKSVRFSLRVPDALQPALQTPFVRVQHRLRVLAVLPFGKDLTLPVPLRWYHAAEHAGRTTTLPSVGDERRHAVWRHAAAQLESAGIPGAYFDGEHERLTYALGEVSITVDEHLASSPELRARFVYPTRGLGLLLSERAFLKHLPAKLQPALRSRFTLSARDGEQAEGWLQGALHSALLAFHEVEMTDTSLVVTRKGGVYQLQGLLEYLNLVTALAQALLAARVPPPARVDRERSCRGAGTRLHGGPRDGQSCGPRAFARCSRSGVARGARPRDLAGCPRGARPGDALVARRPRSDAGARRRRGAGTSRRAHDGESRGGALSLRST